MPVFALLRDGVNLDPSDGVSLLARLADRCLGLSSASVRGCSCFSRSCPERCLLAALLLRDREVSARGLPGARRVGSSIDSMTSSSSTGVASFLGRPRPRLAGDPGASSSGAGLLLPALPAADLLAAGMVGSLEDLTGEGLFADLPRVPCAVVVFLAGDGFFATFASFSVVSGAFSAEGLAFRNDLVLAAGLAEAVAFPFLGEVAGADVCAFLGGMAAMQERQRTV